MSDGAGETGRRRLPAGHRRRARRSFPAVPVAASLATLLAATSGALTLQAGSKAPASTNAAENRTVPAGVALSALQLREDRDDAADRSDRSERDTADETPTADPGAESAESEADERAAWEASRKRELAELKKRVSQDDGAQVIERAVYFVLPLANFKLTSGYGDAGSLWANDHTGQDFAAPLGTPVRSVGAGEIISTDYDTAYGYNLVVRHLDGTETWYCHLSGFARESGVVSPGETIGYVGSTGNSTGPHLHFEVRPYGGDAVDPVSWLRDYGLNL